jgi:hypothetical protein
LNTLVNFESAQPSQSDQFSVGVNIKYFAQRITKKFLNFLKYRQHLLREFQMKKHSIFPKLPQNLTTRELRIEIRRRLKISEQLGLIRKPKK